MVVCRVTILIYIISLTLLLFNIWWLIWEVVLLINGDVHLFNQDTISWNFISLLNIYNISNNEINDWNFFYSSISTTVNLYFLVIDFFSNLQELSFFPPVTETCDKADKQETSVDCQRLNVSSC